jgi:hypothetical protein
VVTEPDTWSDEPRSARHLGTVRSSRRRRPGAGQTAALIAAILGGIGLVVAVAGLAIQMLPRHFSASQQRQIMAWEVSKRWRTLPAGAIFPASVRYQLPASALNDFTGVTLDAARVGIARQAACASAADPAAAAILGRDGCQALLRATYTDESATYVVTVGVAVLPTAARASAAQTSLAAADQNAYPGPGVRAVAFRGTPSGRFGNAQRQLSRSFTAGPYVIMYTAGYTDGRPRVSISNDTYAQDEMTSAARGAAEAVAGTVAAPPPVPHCPGTPGC